MTRRVEPERIGVTDAAALLGAKPRTVRAWASAGKTDTLRLRMREILEISL